MEAGDAIRLWLLESLAQSLSTGLEALPAGKLTLQWEPLGLVRDDWNPYGLSWRQSFQGMPGAVWVTTSQASYTALGQHILRAAGLDAPDQLAIRAAYLELVSRATVSLADQIALRFGRNVKCGRGEETRKEPPSVLGILGRVMLSGDMLAEIVAGADPELTEALVASLQPAAPAPAPKTLDLLVDVELPVFLRTGPDRAEGCPEAHHRFDSGTGSHDFRARGGHRE
jgi:hypothetical protein